MNANVSKYVRNCTSGVVAFAAASAVCPVHAFAAEGAGIEAILPVMDEFIPMLVAFIILWIVLAKFGWPKFEGMLQKRENMIKSSLEKSEEARQESERLLAEYREQLESAKSQAQQILVNAQKSGDALEKEITEKARAEADAMIEKAKVAIEAEKRAAIKDLQNSMADTSIAVASRLIGEDFSDEEHRKLIERYVKEAGSLNA
ncbi:aTP synthase subunit b [Eggerthella sp. CAG:368]|nr:aTP synthase subunit b [Eggerthella sp. CAG:368]